MSHMDKSCISEFIGGKLKVAFSVGNTKSQYLHYLLFVSCYDDEAINYLLVI